MNQLFTYLYAVAFVLIGSRVVLYVQRAHGYFWPCDYVEAWWQIRGSSPTALTCSGDGHEFTVIIGTAIAFGVVLMLVRKLEWRLQLLACVAGLYILFRLGHIINALGRDGAMAQLGHAIYVIRLELAGLAFFALIIWLMQTLPRTRLFMAIGVAALLIGGFIYELTNPSGGNFGNVWKAAGLTALATAFCTLLGYLPAKTSQWLRVDS